MKQPNILVILTDQQRHDCLGFADNAQLQTPHLDAIAKGGVHFANTFCAYPVCTPSRYSLLSGLATRAHGGWSNHATLLPHLPTFPRELRAAGYRTAAVGKMHFAPTYLDVGFDQLQLCEQDGDGRFDDDYHRYLRERDLLDAVDIMDQRREFRARATQSYWDNFGAMQSDLDEENHSTTWIAERALDNLANWDERGGNLLMCGFVKPHHPFDPPAPWIEMYDPDAIEILPGWTPDVPADDQQYPGYFPNAELSEAKLRRVIAYYYATISQIDHHVGRMTALLKQRGLYDDTVIVFASDHGEYLGFHHMLLKNGPMYEPLMRVPLLIKFAGQSGNAGERIEGLASLCDVAPTLLRAAGVEPPTTMKGHDLGAPVAKREWIFADNKGGQMLMARDDRYKLIWSSDASQNRFYDLQSDPLEMHNRIGDAAMQSEIARCREALANWAMFEALAPNALDPNAPLAPDADVAPDQNAHRAAHRAYSEEKFAQYLESSQ